MTENVTIKEYANILSAIKQTKEKLATYESKYAISSVEFYNSPKRDDLAEENEEHFHWLAEYEVLEFLEKRKKTIEKAII